MRIVLGLVTVFLLTASGFSQPWMNNMETEKGQANLGELQAAFNAYWDGRIGGKGTGWKQFKRWEWFMERRLDRDGNFDPRAMWDGWQEKQRLFPDNELDEADWVSLGPDMTQDYYVGGIGRLNCIAFHPEDPDIFWVGAASGGLWKTTDAGESWTNLTDDLPVLGVSGIVVDPNNPDNIYLATGDRDGWDTYTIGVLKTTNGGADWETTGLSYNVNDFGMITGLVMHPDDSSLLVAVTNGGIYRTTDSGESWDLVESDDNFKDLEVNPVDGNIWYASRNSVGIYRSLDAGESWEQMTAGLPVDGFSRIALAVSPADPEVVYALYCNNSSGYYGVFRTTNSGDSWALMSSVPNILGYESDGTGNSGQGWYDLCIAADPNDVNTVFVGGINIWKSVDGGSSWEIKAHWWGDRAAFVHADQHALEFNGSTLYACHDGGINRTTNGGNTWADISDGLVITQVYRLGVFAFGDAVSKMMIGNQDNGSNLLSNGEWTSEIGGDGMECAIDPLNSSYMYGEYYFGNMLRSTNGGLTWLDANNGTVENEGAWVTPFVIDPNDHLTLFRATTKVYRSDNRATFWNDISGEINGNVMIALAVAPSNSDVIYVSDTQANFYRSEDGGENWTFHPAPPEGADYIAVNPQDPDQVYVVCGGYTAGEKVFRSNNGGEDWVNISTGLPNLPANCIVIHPNNPDQIYVGMDVGVYYSPDRGESWSDYSTGLPNVIVNELELHLPSNNLVAATYGRGVWRTPAEPPFTEPTIILYSPNGGETFSRGETVEISWVDNIDNNLAIQLSRNGEPVYQITDSTPSDGLYVWQIANDVPYGEGYRIQLSDVNDPGLSDDSDDTFSIMLATPELLFPDDEAEIGYQPVLFMWSASNDASSYRLQVTPDIQFREEYLVVDELVTDGTSFEAAELPNNALYYWRVRAVTDDDGVSLWSDVRSFSLVLGVDEEPDAEIATEYTIEGPFPNPFNSTTVVSVVLPERNRLKIQVFNLEGKRVATLASGPFPVGRHQFVLDGGGLSSGTYFLRVVIPGKLDEKRKMLLLK